jgi:hypothetical protein
LMFYTRLPLMPLQSCSAIPTDARKISPAVTISVPGFPQIAFLRTSSLFCIDEMKWCALWFFVLI